MQTILNRFSSFRARILLGFTGLILVFLGFTITADIFGIPGTPINGSFARARNYTLYNMELVSNLLSMRLSTWVSERRHDLEEIATSPLFRNAIGTPIISPDIRQFLVVHQEFDALAVVLPDSTLTAAAGRFADAKTAADIHITPQLISRLTVPGYVEFLDIRPKTDGKDRIRIIRQIHIPDSTTKIAAVIVAEIDIDSVLRPLLWDIISPISRQWECILVNNIGGISTQLRKYTSDASPKTTANLDAFPPIRLAISGIEGSYDGPDQNNIPVLAYHRQVKFDRGIAWALILKVNRDQALAPAWNSLFQQLILWSAMLSIGLIACILIAGQISSPLLNLAAVAKRIEDGDFSARATPSGTAEISLLSSIFNRMVARIQSWQGELEAQVVSRTQELNNYKLHLEDIIAQRTRELADNENALRLILDSLPDAIFIHRLDGTIIEVNRKMLELYELSAPEQVLNTLPTRFSSPDMAPEQAKAHLQTAALGSPTTFEWQAMAPASGKIFPVEVHLRKIAYHGTPHILAAVRDITGRKLAEAEIQQRTQELEGFNRAMVNRESRIIELKEEINRLAAELNRPPPYPDEWNQTSLQ